MLLLFSSIAPSQAGDLNSELQSFFNQVGGTASAVAPDHYRAQSAGYYTLGSAYMRVPTQNTSLVNLQLPSFSAGCGGIDMFSGAFSMINSEQLVATGKAIASNALMYAFELAVDTVSPMIAKQIKQNLQRIQDWTQFEINSCEAAQGMVDNLWARLDTNTKSTCQNQGRATGRFSDASQARNACGNAKERQQYLSEHNALRLTHTNIAWQSIKANPLIDVKQRELFMTLSGTVILREEKTGDEIQQHYTFIPPQADHSSVINALLDGGELKLIHCDEPEDCLKPKLNTKTIQIAKEQAFHSKIKQLLTTITQHLMRDDALEPQTEKAYFELLSKTSLPLHKMLNVNAAYHINGQGNAQGRLDVVGYSELIALDIVFSYLDDILQKVLINSASIQFDSNEKKRWEAAVNHAKTQLRLKQQTSQQNLQVAVNLVEQTKMQERVLSGSLTNDIINTLHASPGHR